MECQRLIFINKMQLLECLKNPVGSEDVPSVEDVQRVFGELFESSLPVNNAPIRPLRENSDEEVEIGKRESVVSPILVEEIVSCHKKMKYGSPGCDKTNVGELCKIVLF